MKYSQRIWSLFSPRQAAMRRLDQAAIPARVAISLNIAVERFLAHCDGEGAKLEAAFSSALECHRRGMQGWIGVDEVLSRQLVAPNDGERQLNRRSLFSAHCYAIVVSKGLQAAYSTIPSHYQARDIDRKVARLITAQEVGSERVGHAPNPYQAGGGHISVPPDALVGGVPSKQLAMIRQYRRLRSPEEVLSFFLITVGISSVGPVIGTNCEEPGGERQRSEASSNHASCRLSDGDKTDDWSSRLNMPDAVDVLAMLPPDLRRTMLGAIEDVKPFWHPLCETYTLKQA